MSFLQLNLDPNINKAIAACGYTEPTPIQAQSIPDILLGKDLVACAQTGTGKTAAFVLPALHRLTQQKPSKKTRILILTPTRELANQVTKAASLYGKFLRFNIVSLVGGMSYHHQIKDLARGADIIVATPGRLMDHMEQKRVDLSHVEMLVLDEADRMLDMGFIDDVEYIAKLTPGNRQTLLFSATVDKQLATVVRHLLKNPVRIDLSNEKIAAPKIKQDMYKVSNVQQKMRLLKHLLRDENIYKAIIFTATKIHADKLAMELRDQGFSAAALHGDLRQNVRTRTLEQLRRGKIQYLVATDVAARGIDVSDITHVFNYDLPRFCEDYVHRIGRTGRAGKSGIAISFVSPADMRLLQRIERYTGQRINLITHTPQQETSASNEILTLRKDSHRTEEGERSYAKSGRKKERSFSDKKPMREKNKDHFANDFRPARKTSGEHNKDGYAARKNRSDDRSYDRSSDRRRSRSDERNNDGYTPRSKMRDDRNNDRYTPRSKTRDDHNNDRYTPRSKTRDDERNHDRHTPRSKTRSDDRYSERERSHTRDDDRNNDRSKNRGADRSHDRSKHRSDDRSRDPNTDRNRKKKSFGDPQKRFSRNEDSARKRPASKDRDGSFRKRAPKKNRSEGARKQTHKEE